MKIDWNFPEIEEFSSPWPHPNRGLYTQYSPKIRLMTTAENSHDALCAARVAAVCLALSLGYRTDDGKTFFKSDEE